MKITKKRLGTLFEHVDRWPDHDLARLLGTLVTRKESTREELVAQVLSFPIAGIKQALRDIEWLEGVEEELDEISYA